MMPRIEDVLRMLYPFGCLVLRASSPVSPVRYKRLPAFVQSFKKLAASSTFLGAHPITSSFVDDGNEDGIIGVSFLDDEGNILPGFSRFCGSKTCLMSCMTDSSASLNIIGIKARFSMPMPCSPLRLPF